jgi:hypothetical protein
VIAGSTKEVTPNDARERNYKRTESQIIESQIIESQMTESQMTESQITEQGTT